MANKNSFKVASGAASAAPAAKRMKATPKSWKAFTVADKKSMIKQYKEGPWTQISKFIHDYNADLPQEEHVNRRNFSRW